MLKVTHYCHAYCLVPPSPPFLVSTLVSTLVPTLVWWGGLALFLVGMAKIMNRFLLYSHSHYTVHATYHMILYKE